MKIKSITKIVKIYCLLLVLALACMLVARQVSPAPAFAAVYKAHNSAATIESFVIKIQSITVQYNSAMPQTIWSGSQEVDLASVSSLGSVLAFQGNVAPGKYNSISINCSAQPKVKGSVLVGSTTYMTKTNHTNRTVGSSELEELNPYDLGDEDIYVYRIGTFFSQSFTVTDTQQEVNVNVDLDYKLVYFDGLGSAPDITAMTTEGMYLRNPNAIVTLGAPSIKEVYEYNIATCTNAGWANAEKARLVMLFDAAGNLLGGEGRNMLVDNGGQNMGNTGSFYDQLAANYTCDNGIDPNAFVDNGNGTYTLRMSIGSNSGGQETTFTAFKRQTDLGAPFSINVYGAGKVLSANYTGTYNCTKTY